MDKQYHFQKLQGFSKEILITKNVMDLCKESKILDYYETGHAGMKLGTPA